VKILIFAGAGTSVELGVPAMKGLATEFLAHAAQWNVEPELVKRTLAEHEDVEFLIERLDQICSAAESLQALSEPVGELSRYDTVRSEIEWFVQHAAERIAAQNAHLMWGAVLRRGQQHELIFVTTNYDRAIELAANAEAIVLADGFAPFGAQEVAHWVGLPTSNDARMLVKLHGSTDWYSEKDTSHPLKLRHPMPLFGRGTLRLASDIELGSALVTAVQEPKERRLQAIDRLDELSVALDERIVAARLSDDDATVSRYALGLVSSSPDRDKLVCYAEQSMHTHDAAFADELTLLKSLIENQK
jgi:hypothetical protein